MGLKVIDKVNIDELGRSGKAFQGNVFDKFRIEYTLELDNTYEITTTQQVQKTGNLLTLVSGSWAQEIGAFNGANIDLSLDGIVSNTITTTALNVNGADLTLANTGTFADGLYQIGFVKLVDPIAEVIALFNLNKNSIPTGTQSLIDGESNAFSCVLNNALTPSAGFDDFTRLGNFSGGSIFELFQIERLLDLPNGNKQYQLTIVTKIWDFKSQDFAGIEALGDSIELIALPIQGDISTGVLATYSQAGNTGYQDENFNGFPSDYVLDNIIWEDDLGNSMETMDFTQNSNFLARINSPLLANTNQFNAKLFFVNNDSSVYSNNSLPVDNNVMLVQNDTLISNGVATNVIGKSNADGANCSFLGLTFSVTPGSHVDVTGRIVPNDAFKLLYEGLDPSNRNFVLWIQCEDDTKPYFEANRVNVVADSGNMVQDVQPLGAWPNVDSTQLKNHNDEFLTGENEALLEDDLLATVEFRLPKIFDGVNPWQAIKGRVVAQNSVTGERFNLEEYVYDTSILPPLPDNTLLLDYTQNRGFKLPATSDKQNVVIERNQATDTPTEFGVRIKYPFIVRYEDWLPLPDASDDFFGNKTNNWYTYSSAPNWTVRFELVLENSLGEYINPITFTIRDYNDWGEPIGSDIEFFKLDGVTPLTSAYENEEVIVRATHEVDTEDWNGNEWGQIHVRPFQGSPQWLSTTVLDYSDTNNPLVPLTGETRLKKTVSTKIVTLEARFNPNLIQTVSNVTFTSRVNGDTTEGKRSNIYKETFKLNKRRFADNLVNEVILTEEDRGYKACGTPLLVLADLNDSIRYKNDVSSAWDFGQNVTFILEDSEGNATNYTPTAIEFPNEPDAFYCTIEWRDVLISDGPGCYTLKISSINNNILETIFTWAHYDLKHYEVNGYYNAKKTCRILAEYNDQNDKERINFTDARVLDSIRFKGKFGYQQANTVVDNLEYINGRMEKVRREDFFDYELKTSLINKCVYYFILQAIRGENSCWVSSYNYDDFDYLALLDKPVIVKEGFEANWIEGSRQFTGVIKFEDKVRNCRTHFQDNRQTAEAAAPPDSNTGGGTTIIYLGGKPQKTGQVISYATRDDGDLQRGREVNEFTLVNPNPFGNTDRFTDLNGGQVYTEGVILDWSTYDGEEVFAVTNTNQTTLIDWFDAMAEVQTLVIDGKNDWAIPNINEMMNLANWTFVDRLFGYPPFVGLTALNVRFWTSTTRPADTSRAITVFNQSVVGTSNALKTATGAQTYFASRYYTNSELGI